MATTMAGTRKVPPMQSAWVWFALGLAATLAGFWPSFFSRPFNNALPQLLHGIACTAWLVLLLTQAGLYRTRRLALHRTLGWTSVLLMPLVLGTGAWVLHLMLLDGGQSKLPMPLARMLGFIDAGTLIFLLTAWSLGMAQRKRMPDHARWMATTLIVVLPPALFRLVLILVPGIAVPMGMTLAYAITAAAALVPWVIDHRAGRRHAAFPICFVYVVGTYLALGPVGGSATWMRITEWIAGR
jgi:hypothetical protein